MYPTWKMHIKCSWWDDFGFEGESVPLFNCSEVLTPLNTHTYLITFESNKKTHKSMTLKNGAEAHLQRQTFVLSSSTISMFTFNSQHSHYIKASRYHYAPLGGRSILAKDLSDYFVNFLHSLSFVSAYNYSSCHCKRLRGLLPNQNKTDSFIVVMTTPPLE